MKPPMFLRFVFVLAMAFAITWTAHAEGARARMEQRLPALDALKMRGVVGENNQGFVEVRGGGNDEAAQLVTAENQDRAAIYANIAQRFGTAVEEVGRKRAAKIAGISAPGVWLQAPDGTWYQKK
jgi:uncharacterized protein YdbL (DUF1318 family)